MIDDVLLVESASGARRVELGHYLGPSAEHAALDAEYRWIKELRHLEVDGQPFRRRFTLRGDSLWWFAELYLHKRQVILNLFQTIAALESLCTQEHPRAIRVERGGPVIRHLVGQIAAARHIRYDGVGGPALDAVRMLRTDMRARALMMAARMSRLRPSSVATTTRPTKVAAFVHRAFWRSRERDGSAESYIGPVLAALEHQVPTGMEYVGVGPTSNFRARRWWRVAAAAYDRGPATPIEAFAPLSKLGDSSRIWRERYQLRRLLLGSEPLRSHARLGEFDCWPLIREELAGIAFLQWPWSARAMDEAAAALDVLRPEVVVTYAEAGGWGRALMLEARRRSIPTVGLQHGFIYGSWLNYLHEADEMRADPGNRSDNGFPRPTRTLVFDDYAKSHLEHGGRFPPESIVVTGSPRLDALVRTVGELSNEDVASALEATGTSPAQALVVFVAKYSQSKHVLGALVDAVAHMPDVQLAIKAHPAETTDVYSAIARRHQNVRVLPAGTPLGPLLRASRVVVTVNSTVALDAGVLGIPALVIGLPNNLSPFVAAGAMAGAAMPSDIQAMLRRILYDQEFRLQIERCRGEYLGRYAIASDGRAADRSAEAVLALAKRPPAP